MVYLESINWSYIGISLAVCVVNDVWEDTDRRSRTAEKASAALPISAVWYCGSLSAYVWHVVGTKERV
jgi:hypothetical protein